MLLDFFKNLISKVYTLSLVNAKNRLKVVVFERDAKSFKSLIFYSKKHFFKINISYNLFFSQNFFFIIDFYTFLLSFL